MHLTTLPSPTFLLLQQEGYLIRSSLLSGLHHLRNARVDTKGHFYTAFFQLSIGIERLLKTTFIVNFMSRNNLQLPTNGELRKFSHRITDLFDHLAATSGIAKPNPLLEIVAGSIERDILGMLNEFATTSRYYNLDELANCSKASDPLAQWDLIIKRILEEDVRDHDKNRISIRSEFLANAMKDRVVVVATDLQRQQMTLMDSIHNPQLHDRAARYAVLHMMNIIRPVVTQLDDICHKIHLGAKADGHSHAPVPYMNEFFTFTYYDRSAILRKKKWP